MHPSPDDPSPDNAGPTARERLHEVIFEADTTSGRIFDILLLWGIVASTGVVMLESVESVRAELGPLLTRAEWVFTGLFTVEYLLRLLAVRRPLRYARSFFGVIDLLSILPTWLTLLIPGTQPLMAVRAIRLLRVFRVLKLGNFVAQGDLLMEALRASRVKILVFLFAVLNLTVVLGAVMYLVEGPANGFTSIPMGMYWAIVTMTTVGYGDITPASDLGRLISSVVMVIGYGVIAIPTGIVSVEIARAMRPGVSTQACLSCSLSGHDADAVHCKHCGTRL
ncbi:MAG: ion transporter [Planctomycetota bacterium]|jgi:voltage-gated potassium channel